MKLQSKSSRRLLGYATVVFAVCVPLFYLIIEQLYIQDVDDALYLKRDELRIRTKNLHTDSDIQLWLSMDDDVALYPAGRQPVRDSIYFTEYLDSIPDEVEPYRELISLLTINDRPYKARIRASLLESRDLVIGIAEAQAILLLVFLAGWFFLNRRAEKRTWRPFYNLLRGIRKYEIDHQPMPQEGSSGISEFDELSVAIQELIGRNHQTFMQQKRFIENASHEMQTPLAVFQSRLDLLAEQRMASGDTRHFEPLYESIQHLRHLNKSLLLLHKIENKQFGEKSSIAVDKILKKMVAHYEDMIGNNNQVLRQGRVEEVALEGNEVLFQVLLSNLLSNAVYHNIPGGILQIQLERTGLTISNSGEPLPFAEAELFVRFKKHESLSKRAGVGLGLAIVKEICDKYRWSIHYRYADSLHCFNISFTEN
jgi:signal transduction histidine kinase